MSLNPYKGLNLKKDVLNDLIKEYCNIKYFTGYSFDAIRQLNENSRQQRAEINLGNRIVRIDFYYCDNGTTTISPNKSDEQSVAIADFIKEKAQTINKENDWAVIKNFKNEIFKLLIDYIEELDTTLTNKDIRENDYVLYKYESQKYKDKVTLKYYNNSTLMLQGKPLVLYHEITSFLSEFIPLEETLKSDVFYSISIDEQELFKNTKKYLPNSYKYFTEDILNMITTSVAYTEININLPEYSSWIMPVLKGLDFYIRKIVKNKLNKTFKTYGEIFDYDSNTKLHHLKNTYKDKLDPKTKIAIVLEKCYKELRKERHTSFHIQLENGMSRIIETRKEAVGIINDVLHLIESTYNDIY